MITCITIYFSVVCVNNKICHLYQAIYSLNVKECNEANNQDYTKCVAHHADRTQYYSRKHAKHLQT